MITPREKERWGFWRASPDSPLEMHAMPEVMARATRAASAGFSPWVYDAGGRRVVRWGACRAGLAGELPEPPRPAAAGPS